MRLLITALIVSLAGCASMGQRAAVSPATHRPPVEGPSREAATLRQRATGATTPERTAALQTTAAGRLLDVPEPSRSVSVRVPLPPRRLAVDQLAVTASILQGGTWTRERWSSVLRSVLPNDTLADAALWIGSTPLRVNVSRGGFSVALRFATP